MYIIWNVIFKTTLVRRNRSVNETHWAHSLAHYGETKNLECTARRRGGSVEKYERQTGCVSSNPVNRSSRGHIWESLSTCALQNGIMCSSSRERRQRRVRAAVAAYPDPGRDRCLPNWLELRLSESYRIGCPLWTWAGVADPARDTRNCTFASLWQRLMRLAKAKVLFIVY